MIKPPANTRRSMSDIVTDYLYESILSGKLAPGDRITEMHLARQLQTSQGPVREAIRRLEGMGLLSTERFKRSCVRAIPESEIKEAYMVRGVLEQLAGEEAARGTNLDVAALRDLAEEVRDWATRGNQARYILANTAFYRTIIQQSGNQVLLQSWEALNLHTRTRARLTYAPHEDLLQNQEMHWQILSALEEGQACQAGKLMRRHVLQFLAF